MTSISQASRAPEDRLSVGVVILPTERWPTSGSRWREVEALGFDHAWTYDHVTWPRAGGGPWFEAVATLTAAATVTERIDIGCLVFSANLRHPLTFAKSAATIADVSGDRLWLGVGAGGTGDDARVTGSSDLSPAERLDRYAEFLAVARSLLETGRADHVGRWFTAAGVTVDPPYTREGRAPLIVAANGSRGMALAARHGAGWVTDGSVWQHRGETREAFRKRMAGLVRRFRTACAAEGRPFAGTRRFALLGAGPERPFERPGAFLGTCEAYARIGFTDLVFHYPRESEPYQAPSDALERVAAGELTDARLLGIGD